MKQLLASSGKLFRVILILFSQYHYYISLGKAYLSMGNLDEAERCFKKVVKSSKRYTQAGAYNYLSGLEKARKNYKDALFL